MEGENSIADSGPQATASIGRMNRVHSEIDRGRSVCEVLHRVIVRRGVRNVGSTSRPVNQRNSANGNGARRGPQPPEVMAVFSCGANGACVEWYFLEPCTIRLRTILAQSCSLCVASEIDIFRLKVLA